MNTGKDVNKSADIQPIRGAERTMAVSEELGRLTSILRKICPPDGVISFEYNGALHPHIDVRRVEDVTKIEAMLPSPLRRNFSWRPTRVERTIRSSNGSARWSRCS